MRLFLWRVGFFRIIKIEIEILGQGFEPLSEKAVGNVLMDCFTNKAFHSFTAISAFATLSGVKGISKFISEATCLENNLIVVGVNEKVTSKEALEEILKIENVKSHVFYANNNSIFHPKIYLFEGNDKSILIPIMYIKQFNLFKLFFCDN